MKKIGIMLLASMMVITSAIPVFAATSKYGEGSFFRHNEQQDGFRKL